MKIVIVAGGTGSIALQGGLYEVLDKNFDGVDTKILVNAYDNGLSTGVVRKVMGGKILGPSDVRKNQTTRLRLENPSSPWLKFLDTRFTVESSKAKAHCLTCVTELEKSMGMMTVSQMSHIILVKEAIDVFFSVPVSSKIDYNDFSLANIVYAGFAKAHNNSLRAAARIMASIMGIQDNVILNDDTSLFLGAITASGQCITDEGDIVSWGKVDDPFVDVFFTDHNGDVKMPVLNEESTTALEEADLIILSSGTQWSSLIPTYASVGFVEAIKRSNAKIVMVMNRYPDKDSPGQTATDILKLIVPKYFEPKRIHVVTDSSGHIQMNGMTEEMLELVASVTRDNLGAVVFSANHQTLHDPRALASIVARAYFGELLNSDHFMFDYDNTLVGRGNSLPRASAFNKQRIIYAKNTYNISVCTGNSIKAIVLGTESFDTDYETVDGKKLTVYADGGVNKYEYNAQRNTTDDAVKHTFINCLDPAVLFPQHGQFSVSSITALLSDNGIAASKIENRGGVTISIKPIDEEYRPAVLSLVKLLLGDLFFVRATGRSTIDISSFSLDKTAAIGDVFLSGAKTITYVGDELTDGNDKPIADLNNPNIKFLHVESPAETAFFLYSLGYTKNARS